MTKALSAFLFALLLWCSPALAECQVQPQTQYYIASDNNPSTEVWSVYRGMYVTQTTDPDYNDVFLASGCTAQTLTAAEILTIVQRIAQGVNPFWSYTSNTFTSTFTFTNTIGANPIGSFNRILSATGSDVVLPQMNSWNSLPIGRTVTFYNSGTVAIPIKDAGGNLLATLINGNSVTLTLLTNSTTSNGGTFQIAYNTFNSLRMTNNTILGNLSGSVEYPSQLTGTQVTTLIDLATASLKGALPAWPNNTTTFFRGDGSYAAVGLSGLATQATNTIVGNATSGTAVPTALPVGTCSTAASALIWTTNTGFSCNTSITAAVVPLSGITGFGTGVATALAINVGSAGAPVTFNGALGTPSSGTLSNATGLPISTGVSGLGTGIATWLATPSSANLASALTDETGSGAAVFGTSPTLTTPAFSGTATGTNVFPLPLLAQSALNTMLGNWTGSTANVVANTMPSCADSGGNHLNYVNGTGITCGVGSSAVYAGYTGTALAAGATAFFYNGASAATQVNAGTFAKSGTIKNLYFNISTPPAGSETNTVHLMTGAYGSATASALTCVITGVSVACNDTTHTVSVTAGQVFSLRAVASASAASNTGMSYGFEIIYP